VKTLGPNYPTHNIDLAEESAEIIRLVLASQPFHDLTFRPVTFSENGFLSIYVGHEANIRGGGSRRLKVSVPKKPDEERGGGLIATLYFPTDPWTFHVKTT
jgi:hypothetical protein